MGSLRTDRYKYILPFAGSEEFMMKGPEELVNLAMKEANLPLLRNFGGGQSMS